MIYLIILAALLGIGAIAGKRTILHSFALGFDAFMQDIIWNDGLSVTISARCGLLQARGVVWPARIVNAVMGSPTHCHDAIGWDIERAKAAIALLEQ